MGFDHSNVSFAREISFSYLYSWWYEKQAAACLESVLSDPCLLSLMLQTVSFKGQSILIGQGDELGSFNELTSCDIDYP